MSLASQFTKYLELSEKLRANFIKSLGISKNNWQTSFLNEIPELYQVIYSKVSGTPHNISDQSLMDFIPGYRLVHIDEILNETNTLNKLIEEVENEKIIMHPFLKNYSSDYFCFSSDKLIYSLNHDLGLDLVFKSPEKMFETFIACYEENVYKLDDDGYLDYDFEKESEIGKRINSGIFYWEQ